MTPLPGAPQGKQVFHDRFASATEPSDKHKVAIARIVDQISNEERLRPASVPDVTAGLGFMMSRSDHEFMVRYIQWRMDNPIPK